jgi:arylsulfatase A-like enzyme
MKHQNAVTPNLDKLAKKSSIFKSHFTGIVPCGPARATMLTGLYPFIHRSIRNGSPLDKRFTNIAKEVKKNGYDPKLFGYTDTTWDPRFLNDEDKKKYTYESPMEGFDPICHLPEGNPALWANFLNSKGYNIKNPHDLYLREKPKDGEGYIFKAWDIPTEYSDTTFLANEVINHLDNIMSPFFYHVSFLRPHPPMFVSEPWHSLIDPNDIELPNESFSYEQLLEEHPFLKEIARKFLNIDLYKEVRYKDLNDQDKKNLIAVYLGMCAEVDHNIGRILESLEKNNLHEDTLIVFTSDHGELLGENKMWGKLGWWDSSYRIPLVIHNPDEKNYEINDFTESVDLAPTILNWLNVDIPINWSGESLIDYTKKGRRESIKSHVVFEFDFSENHYSHFVKELKLSPEECTMVCIRTSKWKYVHFPNLPCLLFDLENDPQEMENLADDENYLEIKNHLLSELLSHRLRHQDRQLSSYQITKDGVSSSHGTSSRKVLN